MGDPYNLHLAPTVGRGLPGLPVRTGFTAAGPNVPAPVRQLRSSADKRILAPCPARLAIGNATNSFHASLFTVHPLAGTRDTALMARYFHTGAAWQYQYVGLRYSREAMSFGTPVVANNASMSLTTQAIALSEGHWVYNRPGQDMVYRVTLDAGSLAVSESLLFSLPSSGVLETGEPYTRVTTTAEIPVLPDASSARNLLLSPNQTLVMFHGLMVEGLYWIGCFEYDLSAQLLAVRKLFIPPLHHPSTAPYRRQLVVRHIGRWYHCVFADTGPGTTYSTKTSYFAVRDDFAMMPKVREGNPFSAASTQAWVRLFADAGSVMFLTAVSDTVPYGQAWLLALDAEGAPTPSADATVGQLGGADFVGDAELANNILRGRVYAAQSDLYLESAGTLTSYRLSSGLQARRAGVFRTHQTLPSPPSNPTENVGLVYRYRTLGQHGHTLTATLDDCVQVLMFDGDGATLSDPEQATVYGVMPLAHGFWLGVTYGGMNPAYYQLFEEI